MMRGVLLRWMINTFALAIVSAVVPGIHSSGIGATLTAALVLGLLNALVRPILLILTLPINLLTLGLFTFVINALMLKLAASVVSGFAVHGFVAALLGALLLGLVSLFLSGFVADDGRVGRMYVEYRPDRRL